MMMSLNLFDGMTQDQALGAVTVGSTALLSIAGLIWAGVESEEKKTKTPVSLRSARVKRPANPLTAHEKRTLKEARRCHDLRTGCRCVRMVAADEPGARLWRRMPRASQARELL